MAQPANVWRDPQLQIGPYRILPRTDGWWTAVDERLPPGCQAVAIKKTQPEVMAEAERLVALGSPSVTVREPPRSVQRPKALPTTAGGVDAEVPSPRRK